MAIYGYCRISTPSQSIERQIRNIKGEYPDAVIVQEVYTGTTFNRAGWNKLYKRVKEGDTIVFDSVSRMSRTADEGFQVYQDLYQRGVSLVFLNEHYIDTDTYRKKMEQVIPKTGTSVDIILTALDKFLMVLAQEQIEIAFTQAEKEVTDLRQRTREGIQTARLNGKQIGAVPGKKLTTKKSIAAKEIILKHCKDFGGTLGDPDVRKLAGVARNSYYKYKRELKEAQSAGN